LARINDAAYQDQLKSLQSNYDLALETFQKQENLWKQQIGSEIQYLQAKTAKESLESQIAGLKKQIDMTRIKSPISGNVEESQIKVGQAVSPAMPAFRVVNFSDLKVTADVAEAYADKINNGDEVYIFLISRKK
jgi:multidrug resistance efflux pump